MQFWEREEIDQISGEVTDHLNLLIRDGWQESTLEGKGLLSGQGLRMMGYSWQNLTLAILNL